MEIVKATAEEFDASGGIGSPQKYAFLSAMKVGEVLRLKNHTHDPHQGACKLVNTLRSSARNRNIRVAFRHDGDDLLVKRVS